MVSCNLEVYLYDVMESCQMLVNLFENALNQLANYALIYHQRYFYS